MRGNFSDQAIGHIRDDGPFSAGNVFGYPPNDLAFEILNDFGTALLPPHVSAGDFLPILQSERIRQIREWIGFGGIVIRFVGGAGASAWAWAKLCDAQLLHHLFVIA